MCELLGLSANVPTDICFSFSTLMQRGGRTGPHKDGWGISIYEGRGARSFHDPRPSVASEVAELIRRHAIKSKIIISHIRKANRGRVCLENTHPFTRELWGRSWVFAHNGQLRGIKRYGLGHYRAIGSTDSEHAFCWLLGQVRERFPHKPSDPRPLWKLLAALADQLAGLGTFNMLLSDASHLYAYCNTQLHWLTRSAPFGKARSIDTGELVDFQGLTTPRDIVTLVASRPLTDNEVWHGMAAGRLTVWRGGLTVASVAGGRLEK
jgi:glutamine amidotransferase